MGDWREDYSLRRAQLDDYLKELGVTMTHQRVNSRPDADDDEWGKTAYHYLVVIKRGQESFTIFYSMGSGCVEKIPYYQIPWGSRISLTLRDYETMPKPGARCMTLHQEAHVKDVWRPQQPTLIDVMRAVTNDADVDYYSCFEEWARDVGYDEDSRKAERIYDACRRVARVFLAMFSKEEVAKLRELYVDY